MKRWALVLAAAILIGCGPPPLKPTLPVVIPAKIVPRPVCTDAGGNMGWLLDLRISGQYLVRDFFPAGGYADTAAPIHPAPWPAVNQVYVLMRDLPWRFVYVDTRGVKHYVSDLVTTKPPPCIT